MYENFQIQKWDTDFFGFKVVKTKMDYLLENTSKKLEFFFNEDVKLLISISSQPNLEGFESKHFDIVKVYTRIPIHKEIKKITEYHPKISIYKNPNPSKELISLAKLAGKEGRFGCDSRISSKTYDKIFEEWITNSVKGIAADEVLVYKNEGVVIGFITIKIDRENGYSPLFAVNRNFEGKGVSFALLRALENRLIEKNCKYLISGTQEKNRKALTTFKRFGFELQKPEYVYHLWKK